MVKLEKFSLALHDEKEFYVPGDDVTGELEVQLDGEMEMKEIRIKFAGKAHVAWNEGKKNYAQTEKFFAETNIVHGADGPSGDRVSLRKGIHKFPFRFQLPDLIASSYKDKFGFIKYYVSARIVKPWKIDNKTATEIPVKKPLNLNYLRNMMAPSGASASKNLCCCCCASAPMDGEIQVERRGYVPGEWIIANATLENHSSSRVKLTSIEIVKVVTYYTNLRQKTEVTSLAKEFGPPCDPRKTKSLNDVKLQVPQVSPTESAHCQVIDIQYAVLFMGHVRKFAFNFRAYAPIIVGTIPLNSLPQQEAAGSNAQNSPSTFAQGPPSYAAATSQPFGVGMSDSKISQDTNSTFSNSYYDWNQSAFTYN